MGVRFYARFMPEVDEWVVAWLENLFRRIYMLSRKDIGKELGKGINIYPLHTSNIKGNSINFTIGKNAWSLGSGEIIKSSNGRWVIASNVSKDIKRTNISQGGSAIISGSKNHNTLILLPHTTTIVETSEVIGVGDYIGGTLHSKVGVVAKGVGDISTMLGPGFCGHLMISLHNVTDDIIELKVGETFVSLVFYYLETPEDAKNTNISGHVDKLAELGIQVDHNTRDFLTADWKMSIEGIREKMKKSEAYADFLRSEKEKRKNVYLEYINLRNILILLVIMVALVGGAFGTSYLDRVNATNIWSERYWTIIITGIIVPLIMRMGNLFKK